MEKLKWTTPIKNGNERENLTIKSPVIYKTPVKQYETNSKHTTYQSNISSFSVLPNHITPPSGLTKFMARNPFETDLTNRLHLSVISPTVFSKVSSPSQQSSNFEWSVDELALIQPAKIEEFPIQQIHCIDTETEIKAQAAIDQFFNENEIIPSPWETKRKEIRTKIEVNTPVRSSTDLNLNLDSSNSKKDGWSQTMLTFAPELPSHVMEILKPYFTFVQNQNIESDDANSSNNSLRRKLFFNHEDCVDNDESSICISPVKMNGSLVLSSSPPQSGMLIHGAPLKYLSNEDCHYDTSQINTENLSPPNVSPIHNAIHMSCESVRSHSTTQLNFTMNMSIDQPNNQHKELLDYSLDKSINKKNVETKVEFLNVHNNSICDTRIEKKVLTKNSIYVEHNCDNKSSEFNFKYQNTDNTLKYVTDSCKMNTNDSIFQQTNAMLATSNQQSVSNSAQDTGYQTYSMNNTTNVTDSYNITPVKQKLYWGDQILITDDEFPLSDWKENMKNIFSSTPSRTNREKDNHVF